MMRATIRKKPFYIRELAQMRAIISPARDEILDAVAANGPCTVTGLGEFLGRKPDSLYHHIRVLRKVGLLLETFSTNFQGRATAVYDVPGRPIFLRYDLRDPRKVRAVTAYAGSAVRIAHRRFAQGFKSGHPVVSGTARNLWAARWRGWLTMTELRESNVLLNRLVELHRTGGSRGSGEARLYDFTYVVSPGLTRTGTRPVRKRFT
ncbi:MAG: helix-turn-helix transcriptional regulator [Anaerolineae bacterium]|nr:helix-turn-helix transcriptional regulator [Gemmatimonadaceae bacterium]